MTHSAWPTVAVALLVSGCISPTGPAPVGVHVAPPAASVTWWTQLEACSGRRGDVARIHWHESPDGALGPQRMGEWLPGHDVYLVHFAVSHALQATIQHEMLHDLLAGDVDHRSPAWARCGV